MTEEERLAWGAREDAARKADIAAVKGGTLTLREAQRRARVRMRHSGMTRREAYMAFVDAQRRMRSTSP